MKSPAPEIAARTPSRAQRGRNQALVLEALHSAGKPLGAYELLRQLRDHGFRSPLQAYRALDRLIADGSVHKIESVSAFAPCAHTDCDHEGRAVFAICTRCGHASEMRDFSLDNLLTQLAHKQGFRITGTMVELSGICESCADG